MPVLALSCGIIAGHFFFFRLNDLWLPGLAALALLLTSMVFAPAHRLRIVCVLFCVVLGGIAIQVIHRQGVPPTLNTDDGETALLSGCVIDPPVLSPEKGQFTLELARHIFARVSVFRKDDTPVNLVYGNQVEMAAKIRIPHNFQNPGEFDYSAWLAGQHIYWTATVRSPSDIHVLSGVCGNRFSGLMFAVRTWSLNRLEQLYAGDTQTALLLKAILLGQTVGVERRWTNDFRLTGTYHALVISGQHVSVLAMTLLFLLRLLKLGRIPSLTIATCASWVYAFVSGFSAPVVRAAGGFTLFLVASYLFRRTRILNILAAVALLYLVFDPDELFDASFQLSFLSAAALAVFAIPLMERWTAPLRSAAGTADRLIAGLKDNPHTATWRVELRLVAETLSAWTRLSLKTSTILVGVLAKAVAFVAEAVLVSACVQFGLALPMVAYFHRVSLTGLSANVIVVPLLSLVVPFGFAAILTGWHWLAWATALFLRWSEAVAAWHVRWEPTWRIETTPLWIACLFASSLIALAIALRYKSRWTPWSTALAVCLFAIIWWQPWALFFQPGWLEVSTIDVSQGDSILVVFPQGQTMLVDGGGFPGMGRLTHKPNMDIGEDIVSPYLWSRQIHHLDYAVLTHGHSDHMGGLGAILDNFRPRELWIGVEPESDEWKQLRSRAERDHVKIHPVRSGQSIPPIGGVSIEALAPVPGYEAGDIASNNDSVVLSLRYGIRSVLLTGDAERPVEDDLVTSGKLHPVTLLKVGHHGSKTSSSEEFLNAVQPQFAVISDGYLNQFHHPHPSVLARLEEHHTLVFRTDQNGLVTFRTDGNHVSFKPYR